MAHVGLLLLLVGFIFGIVATADAPSTTDTSHTLDYYRWHIFSKVLLLTGGFLLVTGSLH
jgi:hypothetical protein